MTAKMQKFRKFKQLEFCLDFRGATLVAEVKKIDRVLAGFRE
jgi:hypothetical protein